ncbi:MAG: hypothetical protein QNI84_12185 [Henriciella sp.]|nr:hypothetical protein [Henriciella sp.]
MPDEKGAMTPSDTADAVRTHAPDLDLAKYLTKLDALDYTEEQKAELLNTLWEIMRSFVELGFGGDSMQMIMPIIFGEFSAAASDEVQLSDSKQMISVSGDKNE